MEPGRSIFSPRYGGRKPPRAILKSIACALDAGRREAVSPLLGETDHVGRDEFGSAENPGVQSKDRGLLDDDVGPDSALNSVRERQYAMMTPPVFGLAFIALAIFSTDSLEPLGP